mmetsp:Transcript_5100/g.7600  ORF Transcript_5100/g.7600 Transcript_5100/m.7600 type:complete len:951 (+) Transcript_5100:43-2895(+)
MKTTITNTTIKSMTSITTRTRPMVKMARISLPSSATTKKSTTRTQTTNCNIPKMYDSSKSSNAGCSFNDASYLQKGIRNQTFGNVGIKTGSLSSSLRLLSSSSSTTFQFTVPSSSDTHGENNKKINPNTTTIKERKAKLQKILLSSSSKQTNEDIHSLTKELQILTSSLASSSSYNEIIQWMDWIIQFVEKKKDVQDYESIIPYGSAIPSLLEGAASFSSLTSSSTTTTRETQFQHYSQQGKQNYKNKDDSAELYYLLKADELMVRLLFQQQQRNKQEWNQNTEYLHHRLIASWSKCSHIGSISHANSNNAAMSSSSTTPTLPFSSEERTDYWLRQWIQYMSSTKEGQYRLGKDQSSMLLLFGTTIDAYAKCRDMYGGKKAEEVLNLFLKLRNTRSTDAVSADVEHDTNGKDQQQQEISQLYPNIPKPNAVMYTSVIDAWSRRSLSISDACAKAEHWLCQMENELYNEKQSSSSAQPGIVAYTSVIMAYARSRKGGGGGGRNVEDNNDGNPARLAEGVLLRLFHRLSSLPSTNTSVVRPDINVYNAIMDAWARRVGTQRISYDNHKDEITKEDMETAARAEQWLLFLLQNADSTSAMENLPDDHLGISSSSPTIPTTMIDESLFSNKNVPPSFFTSGIIPDVVSYNTVINAYARVQNSSAAAQRAEHWLHFMINCANVSPTSITYGSILKAWGNTRTPEGADKANEWLASYEEAAKRGDIKPSVFSYNVALNAWAGSGRDDILEGMCQILDRMEQCWNDDGDNPTETSALVPPDVVSYNTLIKACASFARKGNGSEKKRREAFSILLRCLDKVTGEGNNKRIQPDGASFPAILLCIQACVPPRDRSDPRYIHLCHKIVERCKRGGWVDERVLKSLRTIVDPDTFHEMLTQDLLLDEKYERQKNMMGDRDIDRMVMQKWGWNARPRATGRTHGAATKGAAERSRQMKRSSR